MINYNNDHSNYKKKCNKLNKKNINNSIYYNSNCCKSRSSSDSNNKKYITIDIDNNSKNGNGNGSNSNDSKETNNSINDSNTVQLSMPFC